MGQCQSEKSVEVVKTVDTVDKKPLNNVKQNDRQNLPKIIENLPLIKYENYRFSISYCYLDKDKSHTLADRFLNEKFNFWIDRDKTSNEVFSTIDKSDCIIIFISKSYLNCVNCQREARYIFDKNMPIVLVNLTTNYVPDKWIAQLISGKSFENLINTKNFVEPSYENIKKEIMNTLMRIEKNRPFERQKQLKEEEIKKQRILYDISLKEKIERDKNKVKDLIEHVNKVFKIKIDNTDKNHIDVIKNSDLHETVALYRWILKYPLITVVKFRPFTPTGDINDAVFELPSDVIDKPDKHLRSWVQASRFGIIVNETVHKKRRNLCLLLSENNSQPTKSTKEDDANMKYFMKLIERNSSFVTGITKGEYVWKPINGYIGPLLKTEKEIERRKLLDEDLSIMKPVREKLSLYFGLPLDSFCKFAERMKENILELERAASK